ncbi:MAG TPA: hypothetical protein VJP58_05700 [Candidatus Nitrosocosmicus sp.]|nr:hypothetical protein [Candidatus Nitrosocosmicus sp.]
MQFQRSHIKDRPLSGDRDEGTIHMDVVTFNASKIVEVGISQKLHIDNNTF